MKFGPVPVEEAAGAILAHSIGLPTGRLRKGRVLSAADVAALSDAGQASVIVARPDPDDVAEDAAAGRLVRALAPDAGGLGVSIGAPFTGRANAYAAVAGVLRVDAARVAAFNAVDEAITLATLPDHARVADRQMLATVKIIPYGCARASVEAAEAVLAAGPLIGVHPFTVRSADLILTQTPGMKDSVVRKGADAIRTRLAALGIALASETVVAHETAALGAAIAACDAGMTLILTGSATSDRGDVGPAALVAVGGTLTRFGMPVDPGNLLFLGQLGGRPVVGLPGCARSPKLNGADWVIERLAAGLEVSSGDIAAMGVGGLLKEIPSRPQPREGGAVAPRRPYVVAALLAAGRSSRMAGADKLAEPVGDRALLRHAAERLLASAVDEVVCVIRPGDAARRALIADLPVRILENPRAAEGMGTSIAAAMAGLPARADAVLVAMADMPDIAAADIDRLIAAFDPGEDRAIVRATTPDGTPGHPVLFGRRFFEALGALGGDTGARAVVAEHRDFTVDVALAGSAALTDLDTPEDWAAWRGTGQTSG